MSSVLEAAWEALGDPRAIARIEDASVHVSTNRVYRIVLDDGAALYGKVSTYGSYFLFREDHDRVARWRAELAGTPWASLLAASRTKDGRVFTWLGDGEWVVFYDEVAAGERLPRILSDADVVALGEEMARLHVASQVAAAKIPPTSKTIKSDAINLLEMLSEGRWSAGFGLPAQDVAFLRDECFRFLVTLDEIGYDAIPRLPVLVDWNLGNFSVERPPEGLRLFSRWDYDWFRIEPAVLDFYFFSRISSTGGDSTLFEYLPDTLFQPRFESFVRAYSRIRPLAREELRLVPEAYRFFLLHYVVHHGEHFFQAEIATRLRRAAVGWLARSRSLGLPRWAQGT